MNHLLSLKDISFIEIQQIFDIINYGAYSDLSDKVMGTAFFQPSTRTRLSFETAILRLGGKAVGFSDMQNSRCQDNYFQESIEDFIRVMAQIVDVIIMRHPVSFIHAQLSKLIDIPMINAGDGTNEHPTQALQDIWLMQRKMGSLVGTTIAFAGDISRNYRSMIYALSLLKIKKFIFLLPKNKELPEDIKLFLTKNKTNFEYYAELKEILKDADIVHTFTFSLDELEQRNKYVRVLKEFVINRKLYEAMNSKAYIFNAGPRTYEVEKDMDDHPNFLFFEQVKTGIQVRQGILSYILGQKTLAPQKNAVEASL